MTKRVLILLLALLAAAATGCGVSQQQAAELGAQESANINQQLPIVHNAAIDQPVEQLGQQIVDQTSYAGQDFEFYVYRADEINAFALPGGYIYVSTGLIEAADNVSELAGVLAHEVAHVTQGHTAEQIERVQQANLGAGLLCAFTSVCESQVGQAAIGAGGQAYLARYSREAEQEADLTAVDYVMEAGYDPRGLVTMFEELIRMRQQSPNALEAFFSTHPVTEERIEYVSARLAQLPQSQLTGLATDSPSFRQLQQAVNTLQ